MVINMYNLIAHRGVCEKGKENTKSAIKDALTKEYISGIEIDVRLTKDKKLVLCHDITINRTSNGTGLISKMTLKELKKYNFGTKTKKEKIPTLNEILKIETNKIILIEIKEEKKENNDLIKNLYSAINKSKNKNIYITSFNYKILEKLKNEYPNLKCGLLTGTFINKNHKNHNFDFEIITSYNINKRNTNKITFIWALNTKKRYQELKEIETKETYYIVDKPQKFI